MLSSNKSVTLILRAVTILSKTIKVGEYLSSLHILAIKQVKTLYLWLLECSDSYLTKLFTFYAIDRDEAEQVVSVALSKQPELVRLALNSHPEGFAFMRFRRPGHILVYKG